MYYRKMRAAQERRILVGKRQAMRRGYPWIPLRRLVMTPRQLRSYLANYSYTPREIGA